MTTTKTNSKAKRLIVARCNLPTERNPVWLADATADRELLEAGIGRAIHDGTPDGRLELQKSVTQIERDITRQTSPETLKAVLRGVLVERPDAKRVGIITHSNLVDAAQSLGRPFDARIVRVALYGSGQDRASNTWYQQCDLIIVAGTPRVNSHAIRQRLWQSGLFDAALTDGEWGELRWQGYTHGGGSRSVKGFGYRNPTWRQAHRAVVRANLIQAAGRGRSLADNGCDVLILSNEESGFPLDVKSDVELFPQPALDVLNALSAVAANSYLLGTTAVSTQEVADSMNRSRRQVRDWLAWLHERKLVHRIGARRGWWPLDIDGRG
jgi:hypothetical protein